MATKVWGDRNNNYLLEFFNTLAIKCCSLDGASLIYQIGLISIGSVIFGKYVEEKPSKEANDTKVASDEVLKSDEASEEEVATKKASEEEVGIKASKVANDTKVASEELLKYDEASEEEAAAMKASEEEVATKKASKEEVDIEASEESVAEDLLADDYAMDFPDDFAEGLEAELVDQPRAQLTSPPLPDPRRSAEQAIQGR